MWTDNLLSISGNPFPADSLFKCGCSKKTPQHRKIGQGLEVTLTTQTADSSSCLAAEREAKDLGRVGPSAIVVFFATTLKALPDLQSEDLPAGVVSSASLG